MSIQRRIIPISSGKGGVGKTTVAINFALSLARHGKTVLIDIDTGTSSVRNCIDTPVERDLYHFFKRGYKLSDCITPLSPKLDPSGRYKNFGFVASPKHLIEDITNFSDARRGQLIDAINELKSQFIVLDLKAGVDSDVIAFLPYTNSGILVFTPHLKSATMAASDIVKAILFRKLRAIFDPDSPVYLDLKGITPSFVNSLLDRVEDVYDDSVDNLDAFTIDLDHALGGDHPISKLVANAVESFMVYYVLNMFDGIKESYDTAIKPFVENLVENVSERLTIMNLGWVVASDKINVANSSRVPLLLRSEGPTSSAKQDSTAAALSDLAALYMPAKATPQRRVRTASFAKPDPSRYLDVQLDTMKRMYDDLKSVNHRDNFKYIVYRSLHLMSSRRASDFGDTRIFKRNEIPEILTERGR